MFLEIDSVQYHIEFKGTGTPVICLHGFSEDMSTWDNFQLDGFMMILIDLVGHGASDKPIDQKYYQLDAILYALHSITKKLSLEKHYLLGYSFGGRIALLYALTYPENLLGLIMESSSYGICDPKSRNLREKQDSSLAEQIVTNGIAWFTEYWNNMTIFTTQKYLPLEVRETISQRRLNNVSYALANTLACSGQGMFPCLKDKLYLLSLPVYLITGDLDEKYTTLNKEMSLLIPNATHTKIQGCGHNIHIENPQAFQTIVKKFLSSNTNYNQIEGVK